MAPQQRKGPKCGANTKSGKPCKNPAGLRTHHSGEGKCYKHGGASQGAPQGNKNAVVTGEYETLHYSALTPEEQALYDGVTVSPREQTEGSIRLLSVREHRILIRIRRAQEAEELAEGFELSKLTTHQGWNVKGKVDFTVAERTSLLDTIMRLEDALTRVQAMKAKAVEALRAILKENPESSGGLDAIVAAIDRSAANIAAQKEASPRDE
jgi:uncharacterized protein YjcR